MKLTVKAVEEFNDNGFLIFAANYPGAYVRGKTREIALQKFEKEIGNYLLWRDGQMPENTGVWVDITESHTSELAVSDADTEVLFGLEREPLAQEEYEALKTLVLKSASDFYRLYEAIPDKNTARSAARRTFYGSIPRTAEEMYRHTKDVNSYYFGEIGVRALNQPDILSCREAGFSVLEEQMDFLSNCLYQGRNEELWTLRKVLRRFLWHDRIHAKAMYRLAVRLYGKKWREDPFCFSGN